MVERVTINEPTQQEIEPEVEEEVQEEVVEEEVVEASEEVTEESKDSTERPEWLPEKFESAEDLAKAYSELESKLGKGEDSEESPDTPKEALNVEKYADEYADKGELSDEAFKALEEYGIPKDLVEKFIEGQSALQQNQITQIYNSVGGEEKFEEIRQWASENLSQQEIETIDKQLNADDFETVSTAMKGLNARFNNETGHGPDIIQGSTSGRSGNKPFGSVGEYTEAMLLKDGAGRKKYDNDPSYRKQIENRLAISKIL